MLVQALELCTQLPDLLYGHAVRSGRVHSIFHRVCNLEFPGLPILSIITGDIPMKPLAVRIALDGQSSLLGVLPEPGAEVTLCGECLHIAGDRLVVDLARAPLADCGMPLSFHMGTPEQVRDHMERLLPLLRGGNGAGVLPLLNLFLDAEAQPLAENDISLLVRSRLPCLLNAVAADDPEAVAAAAARIAGCGPGLTPATDDMLVGIMAGLLYGGLLLDLPAERTGRITRSIVSGSRGKTVRLSFEMMEQAAEGYLPHSFHALMKCLFSANARGLSGAAEAVLRYGSTSGTDTLFGVYAGCRLALQSGAMIDVV